MTWLLSEANVPILLVFLAVLAGAGLWAVLNNRKG